MQEYIKQFNNLTEQSKGEEGLARTLQASPLEIAVPEGIEAKNLMQIDTVIELLTDLFGLVLRDKILKLQNIPLPQNTQQPRTPDTDTTTPAPTHTT